jgi:hypothetical protein
MQSYSQTNTKTNEGILYLRLNNPWSFKDSTVKYPLFKSSDAVIKREENGVFCISVTNTKSLGQTIQLDLYDSLSGGTKKISSYNFLVKEVPNPVFSIAGKLIHDSISRTDLLKAKMINVVWDDVDFHYDTPFKLESFDLEIDGKEFHSNSNSLTASMIYFITNTIGNKIRIRNDKTIMSIPSTDGVARCVAGNCDKTFILVK